MAAAWGVGELMAQEAFRFAVLADTHISGVDTPAGRNLRECVRDINRRKDIEFVLHCGDETDFGLDEQEINVKKMLDSLLVPCYAVPGNHDATWSESGSNTFARVYGAERFCFEYKGWRFVGCPCGPDIRMSPALISRESLCFIESLERNDRTIFVNHYPANDEISNYAEYLNKAASKGACFFIGGHHHMNKVLDYNGIPGILCRSTLPNKHAKGNGYTIITVQGDHITAQERHIVGEGFTDEKPWLDTDLCIPAKFEPVPEPKNGIQNANKIKIAQIWEKTENANIATGFALDGKKKKAYYGTTAGDVRCIRMKDGKTLWSTHLDGKIFSTPALQGNTLVIGCADGGIYALNAKNSKQIWKSRHSKAILASPVIFNDKIYIGSSEGCFYCINLKTGSIIWENSDITGHIITKALVDKDQVVFGSWGRKLYSLDPENGSKQWEWTHPHGSLMYSPAACWCVKSNGRIFVSIPDRKVWAFDAATGTPLWKVDGAREAVGISEDGNTVYSKSMFSKIIISNANAAPKPDGGTIEPITQLESPLGYDIGPSAIAVKDGMVLVPSDKGILYGFDEKDHDIQFEFKFSTALVNPVSPYADDKGGLNILLSGMDGRIVLINARK